MLRTAWYKSPDFKFQQVALTLDDLQAATRHKLIQNVFNVCGMICVPTAMREAMKACRQEGVDLNRIVFQTSEDEWWQLLPYVLARGTDKAIKAMQTLLDEPDLRMDQRCAWLNGAIPAKRRNPVPVIMPLPHLLVRSAPLKKEALRTGDAARTYGTMLDRMVERGLDPNVRDSVGNTALHVVMEAADGHWTDWWCERLIALGARPDVPNHAGQTMIDVGQERLANAPANTPADDRARFTQSLMKLEQRVLTEVASQTVADASIPARSRPRL